MGVGFSRETPVPSPSRVRKIISLNGNWLFKFIGTEKEQEEYYLPTVDDSQWDRIPVPGFWDGRREWRNYPWGDKYKNLYPDRDGVGWYRFRFKAGKDFSNKLVKLHFERVSNQTQVWLNGHFVGEHTGNWTPFDFDITKYIAVGRDNLLAVRVDDRGFHVDDRGNLGGICGDVSIIVTNKTYLEQISIVPSLESLNIDITIRNKKRQSTSIDIRNEIIDRKSGSVLHAQRKGPFIVSPAKDKNININIQKLKPHLWSPEDPYLYTLKTTLVENDQVIDEVNTTIGFRTFEIKGNQFYLNGKPYFLRGFNYNIFTVRPGDRLFAEKQMSLYKQANINATRFHLAGAPTHYLDVCDKLGILVIPEAPYRSPEIGETFRELSQFEQRLEMLKSLYREWISGARNHPCVIMWSATNEVILKHRNAKKWYSQEAIDKDLIVEVLRQLRDYIRKIDPSRPVIATAGFEYTYDEPIGDVDDRHPYIGWYEGDIFRYDRWVREVSQAGKRNNQPFTMTEYVGAYTHYQDNLPQQCVFMYGNERQRAPALRYIGHTWEPANDALWYQAFLLRRGTETMRQIKGENYRIAGLFPFTNAFFHEFDYEITGKPVYDALKVSMNPILITLEQWNRHLYSGRKVKFDVHIVNDDVAQGAITNTELSFGLIDVVGKGHCYWMQSCCPDTLLRFPNR